MSTGTRTDETTQCRRPRVETRRPARRAAVAASVSALAPAPPPLTPLCLPRVPRWHGARAPSFPPADDAAADIPKVIELCLDNRPHQGFTTVVAFNERGSYAAAGCNDGRVMLWNVDTFGVVRTLVGHTSAVTSITWTRNSKRLLSSAADWRVILWDVLKPASIRTVRFNSVVTVAAFDRDLGRSAAVNVLTEGIVAVEFFPKNRLQPVKVPLGGAKRKRDDEAADGGDVEEASESVVPTTVAFDPTSSEMYIGTSNGRVVRMDRATHEVRGTISVPSDEASVKQIVFSHDGKTFLVNSADRCLRLYVTEAPDQCVAEFRDSVNRQQWKSCAFSGNDRFLVGGSSQKAEHNIYVWSKEFSNLVCILEGPKEGVLDLAWHPTRPLIASVGTTGLVYLWTKQVAENWSAFAPDFVELEDNIYYDEREDEFDVQPDEDQVAKQADDEEADVDVFGGVIRSAAVVHTAKPVDEPIRPPKKAPVEAGAADDADDGNDDDADDGIDDAAAGIDAADQDIFLPVNPRPDINQATLRAEIGIAPSSVVANLEGPSGKRAPERAR